MILSWRTCGTAAFVAMGFAAEVSAQAINIQQPVVGGFTASTTVSVPDRGSARLGGVSSAASGRTSSGIFRPGTSSGLERSASMLSTSVQIHDLRAMDEALLSGAAGSGGDVWTPRLAERRAALPGSTKTVVHDDSAVKAARYEQLARDAEANGKRSVAQLHWQMAAKLGSTIARQRLIETVSRK